MFVRVIRILIGANLVAAAFLALVGSSSVSASSPELFRVRDDCDPATFNAVIGPGTCVGGGDTTFADFVAQLQDHQFAGAWRFQPDDTELDRGTGFTVVNQGGETHSFTPVVSFGGGIVPFLNALSGNTTPAVLADPAHVGATFLPSGGTRAGLVVTAGIQRYQCLIHPWMRTTIVGK